MRLALPKKATLAEGQTVEMTVRLERSGAIEGRIQDESGDGLLGTQVQAVRRLNVGGHTTLAASGASATTNDRGAFRLFNLPAGEYLRRGDVHSPAVAQRPPCPTVRLRQHVLSWLSGASGCPSVVVRAGRDSKRVNVTLAPCRLARLSINPVDSSGVPLGREAQVSLTKRDDVYLPSSTRHTSRRENGTFLFDGIQPGDYYLVVTTSARMEEAAYVNVSIHEADVSLNVHTNTGAKVSGRIIVDGKPAADGSSPSANVWVSSNPPLGKYGPMYARVPVALVRGTDRFELTGLRGPMELSAEVGGGALLSIQRAGEEIAGKTLEFVGTEVIDDVVVALTTQVAQVDVTVTNASSRGEAEPVLVILFSEDPARWHQGFIQYREDERLARVCRRWSPPICQDAADTNASGTVPHSRNPRLGSAIRRSSACSKNFVRSRRQSRWSRVRQPRSTWVSRKRRDEMKPTLITVSENEGDSLTVPRPACEGQDHPVGLVGLTKPECAGKLDVGSQPESHLPLGVDRAGK